jgi:hypothetical protein
VTFAVPLPVRGRGPVTQLTVFSAQNLTVRSAVRNMDFRCFWMLFGATDAPEIDQLQPWD